VAYVNTKKCKVMHVRTTNQRFKYAMEGQTLDTVDSEKDLGITVCTVVQNCCKGDVPSQWNTPIFRPS